MPRDSPASGAPSPRDDLGSRANSARSAGRAHETTPTSSRSGASGSRVKSALGRAPHHDVDASVVSATDSVTIRRPRAGKGKLAAEDTCPIQMQQASLTACCPFVARSAAVKRDHSAASRRNLSGTNVSGHAGEASVRDTRLAEARGSAV